ncbi:hypothetical protein EVAR_11975_1 [Eumeta japonica]|uniref:Uncharacterized protein n=1 Tax=Eumeta variegata TaxID=151549 RepID=A0A4C1U6B1_EUMVA|nr:hypothetical protein EVAR_11975_1 [Eumeta japonica]
MIGQSVRRTKVVKHMYGDKNPVSYLIKTTKRRSASNEPARLRRPCENKKSTEFNFNSYRHGLLHQTSSSAIDVARCDVVTTASAKSGTLRRTNLCRFLLRRRIFIVRHCDDFTTNFTAVELRALCCEKASQRIAVAVAQFNYRTAAADDDVGTGVACPSLKHPFNYYKLSMHLLQGTRREITHAFDNMKMNDPRNLRLAFIFDPPSELTKSSWPPRSERALGAVAADLRSCEFPLARAGVSERRVTKRRAVGVRGPKFRAESERLIDL